jgi:hypothetical protein
LRAASDLYNVASLAGIPTIYFGNAFRETSVVNRYSPYLFLAFCDTLGIRTIVESMEAQEILDLRQMLEFAPFRKAYFAVVDEATSIEAAKIQLLRKYSRESSSLAFRARSFDLLTEVLRSETPPPRIEEHKGQTKKLTLLRKTLSRPESFPFVRLRDKILQKYVVRLEEEVAKRNTSRTTSTEQASISIQHQTLITGGNFSMDQYNAGQAGAMGPQSHAHNMDFKQVWLKMGTTTDIGELAADLRGLREALIREATSSDNAIEAGVVAQAEKEAASGNGAKVMEWLSKTGKWTLGVAEKIGVGIAVAAIKAAAGM